ncbi:hypothetical protein [Thiorhodovibrio winogradskyi]|nr:hypothetical protein [Thiorhodovibrio winogradskyi]
MARLAIRADIYQSGKKVSRRFRQFEQGMTDQKLALGRLFFHFG